MYSGDDSRFREHFIQTDVEDLLGSAGLRRAQNFWDRFAAESKRTKVRIQLKVTASQTIYLRNMACWREMLKLSLR